MTDKDNLDFYEGLMSLVPEGEEAWDFLAHLLSCGPGKPPKPEGLRGDVEAKRSASPLRMVQAARAVDAVPPWLHGKRDVRYKPFSAVLITLISRNKEFDTSSSVVNDLCQKMAGRGLVLTPQAVALWILGDRAPDRKTFDIVLQCLGQEPGEFPDLALSASSKARRGKAVQKKDGPVVVSDAPIARALASLSEGKTISLRRILKRISSGPGMPPPLMTLRKEMSGRIAAPIRRYLQVIRALDEIPPDFLKSGGGDLPDEAAGYILAICRKSEIRKTDDYRSWIAERMAAAGSPVKEPSVARWLTLGLPPSIENRQRLASILTPDDPEQMLDWGDRAKAERESVRPIFETKCSIALGMEGQSPRRIARALAARIEKESGLVVPSLLTSAWISERVEPTSDEMKIIIMSLRVKSGFFRPASRLEAYRYAGPDVRAVYETLFAVQQGSRRLFEAMAAVGHDPAHIPDSPLVRLRIALFLRKLLPDIDPSRDLFPGLSYLIGLRIPPDAPWLVQGLDPPPYILTEIGAMCSIEPCWMLGSHISDYSLVLHGELPMALKKARSG